MNEPEFLNLGVGSVVYRKGAVTPCVIAATRPHVVAVAAVTIPMEDCQHWDVAMAKAQEPEAPRDVYHVVVSLVKISPDGAETQVGEARPFSKEIKDPAVAQATFDGITIDADLTVAASLSRLSNER